MLFHLHGLDIVCCDQETIKSDSEQNRQVNVNGLVIMRVECGVVSGVHRCSD